LTRIKICGINSISHALSAVEAGADLIGVVFASSPRQVTPEKAREISTAVKPYNRPVVGVFANMPAASVNALISLCGLDWVQLSGKETWEYCRQMEKPVIKAIHISPDQVEEDLLAKLKDGKRVLGDRTSLFLLDTFVDHYYGGTGQAFNWEIARKAATEFPLIIAGGLHSENVAQMVTKLKPWGVDVSSGVESGGTKDAGKIRDFIRAVRSAE
jgi:phosphoribosylanthranilate isomerase